jgi:xanthine phosphoribosyltransferase
LGGGILKIDSLLNHQMDPGLILRMGEEIAEMFEGTEVDRILTAEVSGIAPALAAGYALDVPVVYARKHKPITMQEPVWIDSAPSHTKGHTTYLMVSPEFLHMHDKVLIIDDFLATGRTIAALLRLVERAGAEVVGVVTVVEKIFEGGRDFLKSQWDVRIEALATIDSMEDGQISFTK